MGKENNRKSSTRINRATVCYRRLLIDAYPPIGPVFLTEDYQVGIEVEIAGVRGFLYFTFDESNKIDKVFKQHEPAINLLQAFSEKIPH